MSPKVKISKQRGGEPAGVSRAAAAQEAARRTYIKQLRRRRLGYALMIGAALLALEHVAAHLGAFGAAAPSGLVDLVAGWPLAAVIFMVGGIFAGGPP